MSAGSWWRRSRLSIVGFVVAALLAAGVALWFSAVVSGIAEHRPPPTDATAHGGTVAGQELRLTAVALDEADLKHPRGTRTVSVELQATPKRGSKDQMCGAFSLVATDGTGRTWSDSTPQAAGYTAVASSCSSLESAPYPIRTVFIVPDNVRGPFRLEIRDLTADTMPGISFDVRP